MKKLFAVTLSAVLALSSAVTFAVGKEQKSLEKLVPIEYSSENGYELVYDLDGDNKKDNILVSEESLSKTENKLNIKVNDESLQMDLASSWVRNVYVTDINSRDNTTEIILVTGHHANSSISVVRYEDKKLTPLTFNLKDGIKETKSEFGRYMNEEKYNISLSLGKNADIYLTGNDDTTDEVINDSYQEVERGTLTQFTGDPIVLEDVNYVDTIIEEDPDENVDFKKLYLSKIDEIKSEYKNGNRVYENAVPVDLDDVLYFSLQDFNFDGIPEMYHVVCNRFALEYYPLSDKDYYEELYYIKDGKVLKGDIQGFTDLVPAHEGRKLNLGDLSCDNWQNVVMNSETGEVNFITYNSNTGMADFGSVNCYKYFFDKETGTLSTECLIHQESTEFEEKQVLYGYDYIGTECYLYNGSEEEWDISKWNPVYIAPKVVVNGKKVNFDRPAVIVNDRTLVPIRKIAEALNAEVNWNPEENRVWIDTADTKVNMQIGNTTYWVNSEEKAMDVPAQLMSGRTYIPARAAAEALGCSVDWNEVTNTVIITK